MKEDKNKKAKRKPIENFPQTNPNNSTIADQSLDHSQYGSKTFGSS